MGELQCDVIEQYPRYQPSGYTKQISWIDQEAFQVRRIEFYDRKGQLLKALSLQDYRQYEGAYWRPLQTLYQVFNGAADLGLLFEYLYDGRGDEAPITVLDHDLFFGARLALNDTQDTQLLAGTIIDHSHGSTAVSVEFERRIAEHLKLGVESRHFLNTSRQDSLEAFRADDFTALRLSWYF